MEQPKDPSPEPGAASTTNADAAQDTEGNSVALAANPTGPTNHPHDHAALQIDEDAADDDSSYAPSLATTSNSITSSITNYLYENGRRYHAYKSGDYYMPNDEDEQERLNLHHHIWRLCINGDLYLAPIKEPESILDIGTGTGLWAIEVADEFPDAIVIGTELSPIQPGFVPPNLKFYIDDYEGSWDFPEVGQFAYVHWRALSGSTGDFPKLYNQALHNLKSGGYLEVHEYDADIFSDDDVKMEKAPWTRSWCDALNHASITFGKTINVGRLHKQWMQDAGFTDVTERVVKCPIGPWTKNRKLNELGTYERAHMNIAVEAHSMALYTRVLGYSVDQAKVVFEEVKKELNDRKLHMYTVFRFIYGRKPEHT